MKIHTMACLLLTGLSTGLILNGCGNTVSPKFPKKDPAEMSITEDPDNNITEPSITESSITLTETAGSTDVVQNGPYGRISLSVPDGWLHETYPADSGQLMQGMYGIHFYPEDAAKGYIELTYTDSFGVCGTGLEEKKATLAGQPATIGTYDNHVCWDFISFEEDYSGIVALTYDTDDWWAAHSDQVMDILDTLSFDPSIKEGGAYIYDAASEIDKIGLSFNLKNISPDGATLVFNTYDADAPTGELTYGDAFVIEVQKDGAWEEAPIVLEGNYGFNDIARIIAPGETSELELSWKWLYGTLAPGNYRIKKEVTDFRGTGDYDNYTVYAQFVLN